jgi:hypothetical protein
MTKSTDWLQKTKILQFINKVYHSTLQLTNLQKFSLHELLQVLFIYVSFYLASCKTISLFLNLCMIDVYMYVNFNSQVCIAVFTVVSKH